MTAANYTSAHEYILVYAKNRAAQPFLSLSDYGENSVIAHGALRKMSRANPAIDTEPSS
jgi:hypothetical protein